MSTGVTLFLTFFGIAILPIGLAWFWSGRSKILWLAKTMRISAYSALFVSLLVCVFVSVAADTCNGNALYGYGDCTVFSDNIANKSALVFIIWAGIGIIYGALLFFVATILELRARR